MSPLSFSERAYDHWRTSMFKCDDCGVTVEMGQPCECPEDEEEEEDETTVDKD